MEIKGLGRLFGFGPGDARKIRPLERAPRSTKHWGSKKRSNKKHRRAAAKRAKASRKVNRNA